MTTWLVIIEKQFAGPDWTEHDRTIQRNEWFLSSPSPRWLRLAALTDESYSISWPINIRCAVNYLLKIRFNCPTVYSSKLQQRFDNIFSKENRSKIAPKRIAPNRIAPNRITLNSALNKISPNRIRYWLLQTASYHDLTQNRCIILLPTTTRCSHIYGLVWLPLINDKPSTEYV